MMSENKPCFDFEKIYHMICICIIIGSITYGTYYWFGGPRDADNAKDALLQWTQNGTIIEKETHWWGTSCLISATDGNRYYEDSCERYIEGDDVVILMYEDHYRRINGLQSNEDVKNE